MKNASSQITRPAKRAHLDSTTTPGAGILPLLPSREERAGLSTVGLAKVEERRAILLMAVTGPHAWDALLLSRASR